MGHPVRVARVKMIKPEDADAPAEADRYDTIGQFYRAIEDGLKAQIGRAHV